MEVALRDPCLCRWCCADPTRALLLCICHWDNVGRHLFSVAVGCGSAEVWLRFGWGLVEVWSRFGWGSVEVRSKILPSARMPGKVLVVFQLKLCERSNFTVWPDWAKFRQLGKILTVFVNFFMAYLVFGKIFILLWYTFCYWAKLYCCTSWPNIEQIIQPSSHTGVEDKIKSALRM